MCNRVLVNTWKMLIVAVILILLIPGTGQLYADLTRDDLADEMVTISIDDGRVSEALKLLAIQHDLNISISGEVEGYISISLTEVILPRALDVITAAASATWYIAGNVIVVKPMGRIDMGELETRLIRLQYLSAEEARKLITPIMPEGCIVETLSRGGSEVVGGWDEMVEITAFRDIVDRAARIIESVDRKRPLVEIEVKIIETTVRDDTKLGIDWPDNVSVKAGDMPDELDVVGLGSVPLSGGDWTWGRMTIGEVTTLLDFLEQNGSSKLISNPRVTTLSNERAEIEVSTTIPVETLNRFSEAGVVQDIISFQDLDVSINLMVTPRVADDSTITLEVVSSVEEITGYTGPADNQRPITSRRSVTSSVVVKSDESLGLGGLMKEIDHKTVSQIPFLGSIPIIGRLFQHHKIEKEKADLLILITPHIVESSLVEH